MNLYSSDLKPGWEPKECVCKYKKKFYCMNLSLTEIPKNYPENVRITSLVNISLWNNVSMILQITGLFLKDNQIQLKNGNNFDSLNLFRLWVYGSLI